MNKLSPFKWFVLQNFPFIEADFDALTNYELMCKVVEYLNATITKTNELGEQVETLTNWFNNLDVQDEVDHKLDEMVESGELQEIISDYLNTKAIFGFDTKQAMKTATNLIDGSFAKTYGDTNYKTGDGHFYKIREITNQDVVDDNNIVAIADENLVAEKIPEYYYNVLDNKIENLNLIDGKPTIMIGDSYANGYTYVDGEQTYIDSWCDYLKESMHLTNAQYHKLAEDSSGFVREGSQGHTWLELLEANASQISNPNEILNIIVVGGLNDSFYTSQQIRTAMQSFIEYCNTTYPNANVYLGCTGNAISNVEARVNARTGLAQVVNPTYYYWGTNYGFITLKGIDNVCKLKHLICSDNTHLNESGYKQLGKTIYNALHGNGTFRTSMIDGTISNHKNYNLASNGNFSTVEVKSQTIDNQTIISISDMRLIFNTAVAFNPYNYFEICKLNLPNFEIIDGNYTTTQTQIAVRNTADNKVYSVNCQITIDADNVLKIRSLETIGGSYLNINIDAFVLNSLQIKLPTLLA